MMTVIIVAYNNADTIAAAIESVLGQKTSYPYEIWISEDCSEDATVEICREYQAKHPGKVRLFAQQTNTKLLHLRSTLQKVRSRYFAVLDGDDSWCHENKLQIALDTLEMYPEYVTFAHDTVYFNHRDKASRSLVHDIHKVKIRNPLSLVTAPYLHTSARVHRNVIDFGSIPERFPLLDIYLYYLMLDRGPLYYCDEQMSMYNITGAGMWSRLTADEQARASTEAFMAVNEMLGYRYDRYFRTKY